LEPDPGAIGEILMVRPASVRSCSIARRALCVSELGIGERTEISDDLMCEVFAPAHSNLV
jgi:hypothetical protein